MPYLVELVKEVAKFEKSKLAKAETTEKDILPDAVGNYIYYFFKIIIFFLVKY